MELTSYKYTALAFWMDHVDADTGGFSEHDLECMADELDAFACDAASYYLEYEEAPLLCGEVDLRQLDQLRSACAMLLAYWKNGTPVDGGSEVADRVRDAIALNPITPEGRSE